MASKKKAKKKATKRASAQQRSAFDSALASAPAKERKKKAPTAPAAFRDPRMPAPGTVLDSNPVQGKVIRAEVVGELDGESKFLPGAHIKPRSIKPDGERFTSTKYKSLSALMAEARGLNSNGWFWFGLGESRDGEIINARAEEE